jgi:uncharacterized protein (TIGR02246 family)
MATFRTDEIQILLMEMQPPIVDASKTISPLRLRQAAAVLRKIAESAAIPITASVVPLGARTPGLITELDAIAPLVRTSVSPFGDKMITAHLHSAGRRKLVIGGVSTEIAVLHATLDALKAGFEVHLLIDMCGGLDVRSDHAAFEQMLRAGAVPSNLTSFATHLIDDVSTELGRTVMQLLDRFWGWNANDPGHYDRGECMIGGCMVGRDIQNMLQRLMDAWRSGDATSFARPFCENARFVAFDGTVLTGAGEIADYHREPFATFLAGTVLGIKPIEISSVGDGAWLVASEGGIQREGETEGAQIGRSAQTFIIKRSGRGLEIAAFQNTRVRPIDGPSAAEAWRRFDEHWCQLSRP